MKSFKIIMNCIIAILFIISIIINIFVLTDLRIVDTNTYIPTAEESQNTPYSAQNKPDKPTIIKPNKHEDNELEAPPIDEPEEEPIKDTGDEFKKELVYLDNNIIVFFCGIKEDFAELTYLFEITNTSSTALNIVFDNLMIDGERVYVSGLTCEKLLPDNTCVEDFVVKKVDSCQNTNMKREFKFNIKLMNAKSYLDLYETEQVTVTVI